MSFETLIGFSGIALILLAFILNQAKVWNPDNYYYDLSNFIGSALLGLYSYAIKSIPFLIINIIWVLVSLQDLLSYKHPRKYHLQYKKNGN